MGRSEGTGKWGNVDDLESSKTIDYFCSKAQRQIKYITSGIKDKFYEKRWILRVDNLR
jgi:hypothetical protein